MSVVTPLLGAALLAAPQVPTEDDYYRVVSLPIPEEVVLEVGGIAMLPDGRPLVCTRRGQVWIVEDALADEPGDAHFRLFAEGLHEPLGLLPHDGWIYVVQRGELSRIRDVDSDDRVDEIETVCDDWTLSGNYHEYAFGPRLDADGNFWITTNKPFGDEPFGRVDWRGFALRITPGGEMQPMCCGLRSPAGLEASPDGVLFYTDNQGEWCGASKLSVLTPGSFHGHPWGLFSCEREEWRFEVPDDPPNGRAMPEVAGEWPTFELPAVWFPYDKTGRSPSGFVWDTTGGAFGPFEGQLFVGDQYSAWLVRVDLHQVDGVWQGTCFRFRDGLSSGVTRVTWAPDGSLLVGMTDRGWPALGRAPYGLDRVVWTGKTPFEMRHVRPTPDGFELELTAPVDLATATDVESYELSSYTYLLHETYGSEEVDERELTISAIEVSDDGYFVRLHVEGLREGYVHELVAEGLRAADRRPLLHPEAYATLRRIPDR